MLSHFTNIILNNEKTHLNVKIFVWKMKLLPAPQQSRHHCSVGRPDVSLLRNEISLSETEWVIKRVNA